MTDARYRFTPGDFAAAEWDALVSAAPGRNLIQCFAYGAAKEATGPWRIERGLIMAPDGQAAGAAQVLLRQAPLVGDAMAWLNRGPLRLHDAAPSPELEAGLIAAVTDHYADNRRLYLRIAPMADASTFDPAWAGSLVATGTPGWASARLDLTQSLETLRAGLHGKWRNALARAERGGIEIREGSGDEVFERFIVGHRAHIKRLGPEGGLDEALLRALRQALPAAGAMTVLVAMIDGRAAAGMAFVPFGDSAEYLAGHADDRARDANAGQLLLWTAVERLKQAGLRTLDLGGMDEELTPDGIYRFKARVGAAPYRLAGELESRPKSPLAWLVRRRVRQARGDL